MTLYNSKTQDLEKMIENISINTSAYTKKRQNKYIPHLVTQNINNILDFYTYEGIVYECEENEIAIILDRDIFDLEYTNHTYFDVKQSKLFNVKRDRITRGDYMSLTDSNNVHKTILLINDKFVRWPDIEVVADYHYTYLLIKGISKEEINDIKVIYLPREVVYHENQVLDSSKKICFNSDRIMDMNSNVYVIEFTNPHFNVEYFNTSDIVLSDLEAKITDKNIFTFRDGIVSEEEIKEINLNEFIVPEGVDTFIFWYDLAYEKVEHIDRIEDKNLAKEMYRDSEEDDIFKTVFNPLELTIEDDVDSGLKKVAKYNRTFFNELFDPDTDSVVTSGAQVLASSVDGIYRISAPTKDTDSGMMMFVNGELYSLFKDHTYKYGQYYIPSTNIKPEDRVEFFFFNNVENLQYSFVPESNILDVSVIDPANVTLLAPDVISPLIWKTENNHEYDYLLRFYNIRNELVLVTDHAIYHLEDRGAIVNQIKIINNDIVDSCIDDMNNIYILTRDNLVYKYDFKVLRKWTYELDIEGIAEYVEYIDGNLLIGVGNNKGYYLDYANTNSPLQRDGIYDISYNTHSLEEDFIDTPYEYITNPDGSYLAKRNINNFSDNEKVWYKIPYILDENSIMISSKYVGAELIAFSNKSFYYYGTTIDKENTSGVVLPKKFSYCKNWDQFMVFINGRRLDQTAYAITTMKARDPFIHTAVFTAIPLELNDIVDVFYLPRKTEDITKQAAISSSGYIEVPQNLLPYGFNEKTCLIFLNGKKIDYTITKDIHFYKIKLNEDIGTIENLNIVKILYDDSLSEEIKGISSEWDILMESVSPLKLNKLMDCNDELYSPDELSFKTYQADIKTPIYEIFYHYYLADPTSVSDIQLYDFMAAGFDIDHNDIMTPGVFDASLIDKFKPL